MFGGFGSLGIPGSLGSRLRSGAVDYATTWNFFRGDAEFAKTPWAALTRSGLGTRINSSGLIESVSIPRIDHDSVTLAARGLLVEGQATNLATTTGAPQNYTNGGTVLSANAAIGIDGVTQNAARYVSTATDLYKLFASGKSTTHTLSCYYKPEAGNRYYMLSFGSPFSQKIVFDLQSGGATVTVQGGLTGGAKLQSNGYWRLWITGIPAGGFLYFQGGPSADTTWSTKATGGYLDGIQAEAGTVPTSYIPNPGTGTAVRVADWTGPGVALTGAALAAAFPSGWGQNTIVLKFRKGYSSPSVEAVIAFGTGTGFGVGNYLAVSTQDNMVIFGADATGVQDIGLLTNGGLNKVAVSYNAAGAMSISVNGRSPIAIGSGGDFTGTGTAAMIYGSRTYSGSIPVVRLEVEATQVLPGQYITGSALQALTA